MRHSKTIAVPGCPACSRLDELLCKIIKNEVYFRLLVCLGFLVLAMDGCVEDANEPVINSPPAAQQQEGGAE